MDGSKRDSSTPTTESNGTPVPFQDVQLASYAFVQDVDFDAQLAWLESKYENRKPPANPPELEKVLLVCCPMARCYLLTDLLYVSPPLCLLDTTQCANLLRSMTKYKPSGRLNTPDRISFPNAHNSSKFLTLPECLRMQLPSYIVAKVLTKGWK